MAVTIAGRPLRLLVDPTQADAIELDPAAADRLGLRWQKGRDLEIGRITLAGRTAQTVLETEGRSLPVTVATHDRPVSERADGLIGPDLLPYAAIRWHRADAPPPTATLTLPLRLDLGLGLVGSDTALPLPIRLRFSFVRFDSEATAAAASFLLQRYDGRFDGNTEPMPVFLGISRPSRPILFDRAPLIAGFHIRRIAVRIADFRGSNPLPADPLQPGDIVVARREAPQPAQSWVTIANDRLRRCADVTYTAQPRTLKLSCAFDP
ncbi:hypothetical protein FHS31_001285 [Sphingomonas vulcanisoli]|uniref:Uncharacterized protein n=1 Tax=Sphingomonas vulcanisoli TaxID=1658060 RepID=A0ABX0TQ92_9SPHN|nr:hypothetical protein [Sphingomonas vulcanisoli]